MIALVIALALQSAPAAQAAPAAFNPSTAPAYGAPIRLERAQAILVRAEAEARRRGFRMAFAVVDPSGELVAFARMDDVQYGSIGVAEAKAATAARYRRPTSTFEQSIAAGRTATLGNPDVFPLAGGLPILENGRIVGALGVSGATSAEDEEVARAVLPQP